MKNKIKKFVSFFTALVIALGVIIPGASSVHAANTLNVAQYTKTSGVVKGAKGSNAGTYEGKWDAKIPMGKVMAGIESEMKSAADSGYYPHGKDGKNKIAYVEYKVKFPEGVTIDSAKISTANSTGMFNKAAFTHTVDGQVVTFKFPLRDENWTSIYKHYKDDGGATSDKTIDISIPYTVKANSLNEAKALESKNVTAKGDFETHASGTWYSFTKKVYNTDVSTKPLAPDFSKSDVFVKSTNNNYNKSVDIDADLKIENDTGNKTIVKQKSDEIDFTGVLNAKAIKDQMASIEESHSGAEAKNIKLENLSTHFKAKLTLPEALSFAKSEATLTGSNGIFEIEKVEVKNQTATVSFKLVGAENITTFAQLKEAINKVDDELNVTFKSARFNEKAQSSTDYEVTGSVQGNLKAKATHTVNGNVINFDLSWNGKQSEAGKSESNPNAIAISVKYLAPTEQDISQKGNLDGDLLVNGNTQHDKVYEANKNDSLTMTGLLNVSPIKKQLKELEDKYPSSGVATDIKVENVNTSFTAKMTLPEEMKFADGYTVELAGANGKFKITEQKVTGKTITVTLTVADNIKTFKEVKEAVYGVENDLKVNVKGVKFDTDKAKANTNYTINGMVSGKFTAKATNILTGNVINFDYIWEGVQLAGGEDSTDPTTKDIKLTLKYVETAENTFEATQKLLGDILVGDNTEHDKVYEVEKGTKVAFTGSLDVSPVKKQMKDIEEQFKKTNTDPSTIKISDYNSTFTATLTLPEEMDFEGNPQVSLLNDNGKYRIVSSSVSGKTIKVVMTVNKEVQSFAELRDAVNGMEDKLNVVVDGAKFNSKALENTNYTVKGTMTGELKAKARETATGNVINFKLNWYAEQLPEGADAINPTSKDITFTLKYVAKKPPVNPTNPTTPGNKKPNNKLPRTGAGTSIALYTVLVGISGALVVGLKRRKNEN